MHYELEEYLLDHIDPEGDYLYRLWRATNVHLLRGRMASAEDARAHGAPEEHT